MYKAQRFAMLAAALTAVVLCLVAGAPGDTRGSASATVRVFIRPTVTVSPHTAVVNLTVSQTGLFSATVRFGVLANVGTVHLAAAATPLYRADDPGGTDASPIPLDLAGGITISPDSATPTSGAGGRADYVADTMLDSLPAKSTNAIAFQSSQLNRFDQDVRVTVTWNHSDPARPAGPYSGRVRLTALVMP